VFRALRVLALRRQPKAVGSATEPESQSTLFRARTVDQSRLQNASREFYEKLGFRVIGGNGSNFSILQNETSTIGLFQGMFGKK
jgi:hypothetical protein